MMVDSWRWWWVIGGDGGWMKEAVDGWKRCQMVGRDA